MAKKTTVFFCAECGYESSKWMGQCPACRQWNTFTEEPAPASGRSGGAAKPPVRVRSAAATRLSEVSSASEQRMTTGMEELDRVLGGGLVNGSLTLVGGDPGIGKSTLLLQVCIYMAGQGTRILYVSGEESARQVRMRADRLGGAPEELYMLAETNLDGIEGAVDQLRPQIVIIDSIQTMYREDINSAPGSVSQVRECTGLLLQMAKTRDISIFLIGHVTKEGVVAGPRVLEHMVDTVLYFEGDRSAMYRILRAVKNRFGATNEIGVFEMQQEGLKEVSNPSAYMLEGRSSGASGTVTACLMEGTRPMMIEIQALVCRTGFGYPRRTSAGLDVNRLTLLIAVLEKRLGLNMASNDAYINITGGLRVSEPAMDLAAVMALMSSLMDKVIDSSTVIFGEVGLAGEIRGVSQPAQRISEAARLGFTRCILPKVSIKGIKAPEGMELIPVRSLREAAAVLHEKNG